MRSLSKHSVEIWGGMECTINRVGNEYFDQLSYSGHREREGDMDIFAGLGLKKMRYPILWEHHQPDQFQTIRWEATEKKLNELNKHGIGVIAGLVHHGSGPPFVNMGDDSFVSGLAAYAAQVAEKFPWIDYYTPVNEPLTTARFCGLYGLWYPHQKGDRAFCRILVNECKATVMAMAAIRVFNPNAKLVQTDDLGKIHSTPALKYQADFENERRWLSYDLLCGRVNRSHALWTYLIENGVLADELDRFVADPCPPDIFGANYYLTSERYLDENITQYPAHTHGGNGKANYADVEAVRVGCLRPHGLRTLLREAWDRYRIPLAVTEVHLHCSREEQMRWLNDTWLAAKKLISDGIPVIAITPWALLGSFGWDRLLTQYGGTYEAGVFDISGGQPRPTILSQMIKAYSCDTFFKHGALTIPGWWKRSCRVAFGEDEHFLHTAVPSLPFSVTGKHAIALQQIALSRCVELPDSVIADDYLEFSDLVIRLIPNDIQKGLQTGLDLLLDGESGYWEMSSQGAYVKQAPVSIHFARLTGT